MVLMELVFLFGISLIYITMGSLDLFEISRLLFVSYQMSYLFFFSLFFILISFFFKIGIFPFHFYVIDLYKTVSFYSIIIFSTLPKFVYFYFISIFVKFFLDLHFFFFLIFFF
jgi:NADH:ubiquinone oxidoreductase subunit 2 (subunit N)